MNRVIIINLEIESISPLYIKNDDQELLFSEEENAAYLPATSIAGSFRSYLYSIGESSDELFGSSENSADTMSKVFISDAYAAVRSIETRKGVAINPIFGSAKSGHFIDRRYLEEGLKFELNFKLQLERKDNNDNNDANLKVMLYKCIKGLHETQIRFGGNKSNGLGCFKVNWVNENDFDLHNKADLIKYFKRDLSEGKDITEDIMTIAPMSSITEFLLVGAFSTPMLIGAPSSFNLDSPDNTTLYSAGNPIVPGSSLKGVLRARMEKIAALFENESVIDELFGGSVEKDDHFLSRVMVRESKLEASKNANPHKYYRIKTDKFTGGTFNTALMDDLPVTGKTEFRIMYRKLGNSIDDQAIGFLSLALRDLGTENITIGNGESIGRGRFKADTLVIKDEGKTMQIDFINKSITGEDQLQKYIDSIKEKAVSK